jgi:hypothetical protein
VAELELLSGLDCLEACIAAMAAVPWTKEEAGVGSMGVADGGEKVGGQ